MDNSPLVIFRMVAHNSEKTIARAMESVLKQSYANLELHVGIRASTDGTADIAREYASHDPRVRVIINKQAFEYDAGNDIKDYYGEYGIQNTYIAFIDGDDEYTPDFLEKMIPFAEDNRLDIAACGKEVVNIEKNSVYKTTKSEGETIVEGDGFETQFSVYHKYMRTRWAKLFRLALIPKLDRSRIFWLYYSDDTVETLEYFRHAGRVGIYPGAFYRWYCSGQSLSYKWDDRRIESDRKIYELTKRFLTEKAGRISKVNFTYLCAVHVVAVRETIEVLLPAQLATSEKLRALHSIMTDKYTVEALGGYRSFFGNLPAYGELISLVAGWISSNEREFYSDEAMTLISDILTVME